MLGGHTDGGEKMSKILEMADQLAPLIRDHCARADTERKLAGPVIQALRGTALGRMTLAKADGGEGAPLPETLMVYERLAREDAAFAWVLWNSGLVTFFSRFMPAALKREVFKDATFLYCQSTRPMGTVEATQDGYVARGHWTLVSGCDHADWAFLTCVAMENGAPIMAAPDMPRMPIIAVPKHQIEIIDTWDASGLRGTGSHDVRIEDTQIPAHRVFEISDQHEMREAIDRVPIMSAVTAIFAAQALGVSQTACDHIQQRGRDEITPGPMPDLRDRPEALTSFASHWAALSSARLGLHAAADMVWEFANSGKTVGDPAITSLYAASMHAMSVARLAMRDLHALGGTRALYVSSPLEKRNRDLQAMFRHIVAQPSMRADVGRSLFGAPPQWPLYAI